MIKIQQHVLDKYLARFNHLKTLQDIKRAKEEMSMLSTKFETIDESMIIHAILTSNYKIEEKCPADRALKKLKKMGIK